jgi:hypothetical protein
MFFNWLKPVFQPVKTCFLTGFKSSFFFKLSFAALSSRSNNVLRMLRTFNRPCRSLPFQQGCQSFLDSIYQNGEKLYQMTTKLPIDNKIYQMAEINSKWPKYIPNDHKIDQHYLFQGPPK